MWFLRKEVLTASVMLLLCSSECKPQAGNVNTDCLSPTDLLNALTGTVAAKPCASNPQGNGIACTCVPLLSCCGSPPSTSCPSTTTPVSPPTNNDGIPILEGIVDDRRICPPQTDSEDIPKTNTEGIPILIGLVDDRTGTLHINLTDRQNSICSESLSVCCPTPCKIAMKSPDPIPPPQMECGIKNDNGIGVTINGFDGQQAQLGEFPWMVGVLGKDNLYVGGGSLVHPKVVLTAAHKVHNKEGKDLIARVGDWDLSNTNEPRPHQSINVERVILHPAFDRSTLVNNVALLILESSASLSDTVMPICLPEPRQTFDGSNCIVTGWGKDVFGKTGKYQKIMKELHLPAISHNQCQNMLRNIPKLGSGFNLHNTFNCAGGNGEDACTGDGGSPLVCPNPNKPDQYIQMGVVAWGIGCGQVGHPGVYGSIPQTVDWISKTILEQTSQLGFDIRIIKPQ